MDIVERVARALYDLHDGEAFDTAEPTYDELDDQIKGWYMEQAETALSASGVAELVEALENCRDILQHIETNHHMFGLYGRIERANKALARYRGEA